MLPGVLEVHAQKIQNIITAANLLMGKPTAFLQEAFDQNNPADHTE